MEIMPKINWNSIWEWSFKVAIAAVIEVTVILLADLKAPCVGIPVIPCGLLNLLLFIFAFFISLGVVQIIWTSVEKRFKPNAEHPLRKKVNLTFEEYIQNTSAVPYLSYKVLNHELFDIEKCYVTLLELENLYTPTVTLPILETVNPNNKFLSWGGGSNTEHVTIPRSDGIHPGTKVLNIAKGAGDVVFLFHGHESNYHGSNFRAKIKIDGEVDGIPIQSIGVEFCFKYGVNHYTTRQKEPEIGEKQRITIVVTDIKSRFAFEDCDKIWVTPVYDVKPESKT